MHNIVQLPRIYKNTKRVVQLIEQVVRRFECYHWVTNIFIPNTTQNNQGVFYEAYTDSHSIG